MLEDEMSLYESVTIILTKGLIVLDLHGLLKSFIRIDVNRKSTIVPHTKATSVVDILGCCSSARVAVAVGRHKNDNTRTYLFVI